MRKKLQDYLPPILLKTYEFPRYARPSSRRLTACMMPLMRCLTHSLSVRAGEYAISRYEKIFGVVPQDTDTLDERPV